MEIKSCYVTDIGIQKQTNQDSLLIKVANTPFGRVAFSVVCDGMGGLAKGEIASAALIAAFEDWFNQQLPALLQEGITPHALSQQWNDIIQVQNQRIAEYGRGYGISLGTTAVALLLLPEVYYALNVGDSRVYELTATELTCLTQDQTLIAQEIRAGRLTPEQAETDPRRSVLLQCVGASNVVTPEFLVGQTHPSATYLLCSDGFRHVITEAEIHQYLNPQTAPTTEHLQQYAQTLVDLNKQRLENDNITVVLLQTQA
ncbi:MAG: PP2C family serine/threonine-protein phosphatase [Faecalibacterium sp.]